MLFRSLASKAVALREANKPEFKTYARTIVKNCKALANNLMDLGFTLATDGTDNHLLLINVAESCDLTGTQAASALRECGITLNFNSLPFDPNGPLITSGLRIGTAAATTLGMTEIEMAEIAAIIRLVLDNTKAALLTSGKNAGKASKRKYELDAGAKEEAQQRIQALLGQFPVYPELDLDLLNTVF